ncbi:MAG: hypothetical protein A3B68_02820 [Candidatus Melainabacteria bacterium RIFCSPHIGHO2_02_FULL_34_12]|nr:MAG: hypothetical protein A3B68_02820 [Candidatus Melainabacteria bacterium RIFCSPHIGHO2_02_FULL_34_12]
MPDPRRRSPFTQFIHESVQRASGVTHSDLSLIGMHNMPEIASAVTQMLMACPVRIRNVILSASIKNGFLVSQARQGRFMLPVQEPVRKMIEYRGEGEELFSRIADIQNLKVNFTTATQNALLCTEENACIARRTHIFNLFSSCGVTTVSDFANLDIPNMRLMEYQMELTNFYNPDLDSKRIDAEYILILQTMQRIVQNQGFVLYAHIGATKANIFCGPPGALISGT